MDSISDIKHAFYINLESRPDRKSHVEEQLKSIGINATRFNAIKLPNGAIGCSVSHLKCLEIAKRNNYDHILIVEDDIKFLNPSLFVDQLNKFLNSHKTWDVVLVAGNNIPPYKVIDESCVQITKCQTTTGYMVKSHYYDTLIDNIREGTKHLMREPEKHVLYAIDKYWFRLQDKDLWYLITPLTVTQREDYSDIEKRPTNYTNVMTDLDKKWFFERQKQNKILKKSTNDIKMNKPSVKINMNIEL
jgi:GR25 family glycosyltransferase involved in LPS biosynthesis